MGRGVTSCRVVTAWNFAGVPSRARLTLQLGTSGRGRTVWQIEYRPNVKASIEEAESQMQAIIQANDYEYLGERRSWTPRKKE